MRITLPKVYVIVIGTLLLGACNSPGPPPKTDKASTAPVKERTIALRLMQSNCASCHALLSGGDGPVIAPGMGELRSTYLSAFQAKEDFVNAVSAFSKNPTKEAALMQEAVAKYGLMPKLGVAEADLRAISEYLYLHEVGTQAWYESLSSTADAPTSDHDLSYEERGRNYAMGTKQALGSKLLAAVQKFGPAGAVDFCNIQALPITDSMSVHYGASIKRVSDKPRNAANQANAEELAYIAALKVAKAQGEELPALISQKGSSVQAYYAIETNDMCLKCHGRKDADIAADTWQAITERYPADKAFGYGPGEIRGLFVVEFTP